MTKISQSNSFIDSIVLNSIQKKAVLYNDGPQLVFAGAGTGKTRVLTSKIAFLIVEEGVAPNNIFAATFTNKAAKEMKVRVENFIGVSCNGLWIGTFHSLCARILRQQAHNIGYKSSFTIYDTQDQLSLVKKIMNELDVSERTIQPKHLLRLISNYKNLFIQFKDIDGTGKTYFEKEVINAFGCYQKKLKEASAMDFDDLLTHTVLLFQNNPSVLESYQRVFRYILVDEFQDTNLVQFKLVKLLSRKNNRIFAVGDDDQSIYSWRGARIENILSFDKEFPGTRVFKLEQNYRSSKPILDFANSIISSNSIRAVKKLWTSNNSTDNVTVVRYRDDRHEADATCKRIKQLQLKNVKLGTIATLFRTNAQSRIFEDVLRKNGIPYIIVGGVSFYERKEIKDCLAYLRLLVNPNDNISCERIINTPPRGIGAKTIKTLNEIALRDKKSLLDTVLFFNGKDLRKRVVNGLQKFRKIFVSLHGFLEKKAPPHEILLEMLSLSEYIDSLRSDTTEESRGRVENINELVNALSFWHKDNPEKTLVDFLEEISLISNVDEMKQDGNSVNLMTLHCAKGLEFSHVFLVGLEEGIIPSKQNYDDNKKIEEECRLLYVGVTRAMKSLVCSFVNDRMRFGTVQSMDMSRFIEQIPKTLYRFDDKSIVIYNTSSIADTPFKKKSGIFVHRKRNDDSKYFKKHTVPKTYDEYSQDTVQFRMGQIVSHNKYGQGKILAISGFGEDMRLTVLFNNGNRKKMMARFANLQVI